MDSAREKLRLVDKVGSYREQASKLSTFIERFCLFMDLLGDLDGEFNSGVLTVYTCPDKCCSVTVNLEDLADELSDLIK